MAHAIRGIIVGLDQETQTLLTKATQWFSAAIEFKEPSWGFPPNYCQSCQYGSLALCRWLSLGEHDQETLAKAVEHRNNYFIERPRELYDPRRREKGRSGTFVCRRAGNRKNRFTVPTEIGCAVAITGRVCCHGWLGDLDRDRR